ncbi:vegetative cell wall protein gp1-like [Iris pallida]|uniref:Vegetative cell wall protein gp1-like n=1 Tax=Iris pallida TaxID=29817 RepID=A0AAX6G4K7_IRIPA|nr:vegetative cell wall protein gp1-like [Iris pallida]
MSTSSADDSVDQATIYLRQCRLLVASPPPHDPTRSAPLSVRPCTGVVAAAVLASHDLSSFSRASVASQPQAPPQIVATPTALAPATSRRTPRCDRGHEEPVPTWEEPALAVRHAVDENHRLRAKVPTDVPDPRRPSNSTSSAPPRVRAPS